MGLLVGIERDHAHEDIPCFAGIRTFPLITRFGFLCAGGADIALYVCDPNVLLRPAHLQRQTSG